MNDVEVIYTGNTDVRILTAADFKRLGVEDQNKVELHYGEPTTVSAAAAEVLHELGWTGVDKVEAKPEPEPTQPELPLGIKKDEGSDVKVEGDEEPASSSTTANVTDEKSAPARKKAKAASDS